MTRYTGLDATDLKEIYTERRKEFLVRKISEKEFSDVLARLGYLPSEVELELLAVYEERKRTSDITAELRNWHEHSMSYNKSIFSGMIYGDVKGRFEDGRHVVTTYVVKKEIDALGNIKVHTMNSIYMCYRNCKRDQSNDQNMG